MKKNSFLKVMAGLFVLFVIASWIIPTGYYSSGTFTEGTIEAFGLVDFIKYPVVAFTSSVFVLYAVVFFAIGGFYGVLNKAGVFQATVEKIANKFSKKTGVFLLISVLTFSILESLTALTLPLFVLVPLAVAVLMKLGYNKMTSFLATVGALLLGNLASTYGFNVNGYASYFYGTDINTTIVFRIGFFVLTVGLLLLYLFLFKKQTMVSKKKKSEAIEIPLYKEETKKAKDIKLLPFIITISSLMVLALVGMYNWSNGLGITFFTDVYEKIVEFEYNGYPIFGNLIGAIDPIGYWTNYDLVMLIIIATLVIAKVYNVKFKDMISSFLEGMKEMLPVVVLVIVSNLIFLLANSTTYTMYPTIHEWITGFADQLNLVTVGLSTLIGSLIFNDFPYMLNTVYTNISGVENVDFMIFIQQALHGFVSLVAPTSFVLIAGLTYLKIDYKEFLKSIWKPLLILFGFIVMMLVILAFI